MLYRTVYSSPIVGRITLVACDDALVGLWIDGQKYFMHNFESENIVDKITPVLADTIKWLDKYFDGQNPETNQIKINPNGSAFARIVWGELCKIPYGKTVTYGYIADRVAKQMGKAKMSARAVGAAIGRNPVSILIPCHRVIGKNGKLTGYAGGIENKRKLLMLENVI